MTTPARSLAVLSTLIILGGCAAATPGTAPTPPATASSRQAQSQARPTELLVKFRIEPSEQRAADFGAEYGMKPKQVIETLQVYVMTITTGEDPSTLADRVDDAPEVAYAEPNYLYHQR